MTPGSHKHLLRGGLIAALASPIAGLACPSGMAPNAPAGAGTTVTSCRPADTQPKAPAWETRWGAFAFGSNGEVGVSQGKRNQRAAKKAAISECAQRGGIECESDFAFKNQCAAIASGNGRSKLQGAPTEEEAKNLALQRCHQEGNGECWIYYSGCSPPVRVR